MRAARRLGSDAVAIVKACAGALKNSSNAHKLLDAVSSDARDDLGYMLCRIHSLLRSDSIEAATKLMLLCFGSPRISQRAQLYAPPLTDALCVSCHSLGRVRIDNRIA